MKKRGEEKKKRKKTRKVWNTLDLYGILWVCMETIFVWMIMILYGIVWISKDLYGIV